MSSPSISISVPPALYIPAICLCQLEQALYWWAWGSFRAAEEGGWWHRWQMWGFSTGLMIQDSLFACSTAGKATQECSLSFVTEMMTYPGGKWGHRLKFSWILLFRELHWACDVNCKIFCTLYELSEPFVNYCWLNPTIIEQNSPPWK